MNKMNSFNGNSIKRRIIASVALFAFFLNTFTLPAQRVYAQETTTLPAPGLRVELSPSFVPPVLTGVKVFSDNPFRLDFILDKGNSNDSPDQLKDESTRLIKYFLASLTVPEKDVWVNLSPYEKNRIVPEAFGQTEMGRDLLAQDYLLKQITASLIYPEGEIGKKFWKKVYERAYEKYGTTDLPVDTFNKVWIVPEKAVVYENKDRAYVIESRLKVMLESDYLALEKNTVGQTQENVSQKETQELAKSIIREIVIPELEKEVNEGKNFAQLRQVYHSIILAAWFKRKIKESILGKVYVDQQKINGVDIDDKTAKDKIYQQYLVAFKKGVYNYIKEEYNPTTQETIPKKYFSGGVQLDFAMDATNMQTPLSFVHDSAMVEGLGANKNSLRVSVDLAMKSKAEGFDGFRTFMEYSSSSLGRDLNSLGELELLLMWPLYSFEVDRKFAEARDYQGAYKEFYDAWAKGLTRGGLKLGAVRSYSPIIKKPFSTVQEIKDAVNIDTEWSIDFLPTPNKWKGPTLYNFILSVLEDGQLHMSFYDGNGLIREFNTDQETESALREIGIIDGDGLVVLVRSSLDDRLKNNAVPGIGNRLGLSGHSHPKGSSVVPSQTGRIGTPADVELFHMKWMGLPASFPVDKEIPALAQRPQAAIGDGESQKRKDRQELALPNTNLPGVLSLFIKRLEESAGSQGAKASNLPIDELALYLKVLNAMYEETIAGYEKHGMDHEYVHLHRAEFAGELAFHPRFQVDARNMLRASFEGAFRILAQQFGGSMDNLSSLEEMMGIMSQLVEESSTHPELREMALSIINDPQTYGLDDLDLSKTDLTKAYPAVEEQKPVALVEQSKPQGRVRALIGAIRSKITGKIPEGELVVAQPEQVALTAPVQAISPVTLKTMELAVVSDGLIAAAEKGERDRGDRRVSNQLKPRPEEVIRARASRLLILANGAANDDPQLAEASLKEYLRLVKTFGDRVDFYVAVTLDKHRNVMTNAGLRSTLLEIARGIPDKEDRFNMLTEVALQLIGEGDLQGALNLMEEVGTATFYTFAHGLERMIGLILVSQGRNDKMVKQLVRIIENIPDARRGGVDERKVRLLVRLGERYDALGMAKEARSYYEKAWEASGRVELPAMIRLEYFVPLMREKGIKFPVSRDAILEEVRRMAESDLQKPYPNERPDKMIALGREYAFNRDYQKAEESAKFINDNMDYPRDHYDHVYGAIIEAAALYGDNEKVGYAASKMTNYVKDHFERAAQLLVDHGDYVRAMGLGNGAANLSTPSVGYWGSTQLRVARSILRRDGNQIGMIRGYIETAIAGGIGSHDLEDLVNLISDYPALDPDGQFILTIFKTAFEKNRSWVQHASHRIILQNLRRIIMARVREANPALLRITDVFTQANGTLPASEMKALTEGTSDGAVAEPEGDKAQTADYGGIDLTADKMKLDVRNEGEGIKFNLYPSVIRQLQNMQGFSPVIIDMQPLNSIPSFLGVMADVPADKLSMR